MRSSRSRINPRRGFTLVELLVVVSIVVILSATTLPAIMPAFASRRVSEASRIVQAELSRQRDLAVRANSPRGFRLIPDPIDLGRPNVLTSSRIIAIEPAPDYSEGELTRGPNAAVLNALLSVGYFSNAYPLPVQANQLLFVTEVKSKLEPVSGIYLPTNPTSWFWNVRRGEKIRLSESGREYTILGPMIAANPEGYINMGSPADYPTGPGSANFEFLILADGVDNPDPSIGFGNGFVDEICDGIDNDGDGIVDPGFNGLDDNGDGRIDEFDELFYNRYSNPQYPGVGTTPPFAGPFTSEFERQSFQGKAPNTIPPVAQGYSITRRPVPVEGARDIQLPTNVVIDLTTWNGGLISNGVPERSRLPVDPFTGYVDVMVAPNGQILVAGATSNASPPVAHPYYHFWITELDDVFEPTTTLAVPVTPAKPYRLPMPREAGNDPRIASAADPTLNQPNLKSDRRMLSVNTRTGAITSTAVETFYLNNPSYPYEAAESGVKDVQP